MYRAQRKVARIARLRERTVADIDCKRLWFALLYIVVLILRC